MTTMTALEIELDFAVFAAIRTLRPEMETVEARGGSTLAHVLWGDVEPVTAEEVSALLPDLRREEAMESLRGQRNALLSASDWTQMPDVAGIDKQAWTEYRQALRDLPSSTADPENPVWPEPPA